MIKIDLLGNIGWNVGVGGQRSVKLKYITLRLKNVDKAITSYYQTLIYI